ncbi:MAG: hypothetical protein PHS24_05135 [Bacilli bacterium]|nr:hypothetical protein [Bacilli bacterium]
MKKKQYLFLGIIILIIILIITFILLKNDKMTCVSKALDDLRTTNEKIDIYYKGNGVKKIVQEVNHEFNDIEAKNIFNDYLDNTYNNLKDNKYIKISKNEDELAYKVISNIKVSKLKDEELTSLQISNNFKELQSILEDKGFECK